MKSERRKRIEDWIESYLRKRSPEDVQPVLDALDAFERIERRTNSPAQDLEAITAAASSPRSARANVGCDLLRSLAAGHSAARDAVAEMARSKRAEVRFNALVSVDDAMPVEFLERLLCAALRDRSSKVRAKAADRAVWLGLRWMVPAIEVALRVERNADVRSNLEFCRTLLADGFVVGRRDSGGADMTTLEPAGGA